MEDSVLFVNPTQCVKIQRISQLKTIFKLQIPNFQRIVDEQHVDEIYNGLINNLKISQQLILPGTFTICVDKQGNQYLCDGNHRFQALNKLSHDYQYDASVICHFIEVQTEEEAKTIFTLVNNTKPVAKLPDNVPLIIPDTISSKMKKMYPKLFRDKGCLRPHLYDVSICETIGKIIAEGTNITIENFFERLWKINTKYEMQIPERLFEMKTDNVEKINKYKDDIKNKGGLYVGLKRNNDWIYEMYDLDPDIKKTIPQRKKIPDAVRNYVYQRAKQLCQICQRTIDIRDMDCGHIIPFSDGGSDDCENLISICKTCNTSMQNNNARKYCELKKIPITF